MSHPEPTPLCRVRAPLRASALAVLVLLVMTGCSTVATVDSAPAGDAGAPANAGDGVSASQEPTPAVLADSTTEGAAAEPASAPAPAPAPSPVPPVAPGPDGPCGVGPLALPNPDRPIYSATLEIDPMQRTIKGSMSVDFGPDLAVDELIVRLWPNGPRPGSGGVKIDLTSARLPSGPVAAEFVDPTLVKFALPTTLQPGQRTTLDLEFEMVAPIELRSRISGRDDYMRLGTILPLLPWEPGVGWASDAPTRLFGEAATSPVADWTVAITVPSDYDVLASGIDDGTGTWSVQAARDFALSIGRFRTIEATAMAPEPVAITVGVHETIDDDPQVYMDKIVRSLEQFSSRFGQYPWPSLTFAVTPNLRGGIEFPTHIMQGQNTTGRVTSHEVGHMFFYSLVGNNQGADPWIDEGITSYAEFTFEGTPADSFALVPGGIGQATRPMPFWESQPDAYYTGVYAQTGFALQKIGPQEKVDCALARFVADNAHRVATPADFVAAFEPDFPDIVDQLAAQGVNLNIDPDG